MEITKKFKKFKSLIFIIPAVIAFFLVLIPTLKYQWPLSWDAIYQVQYAQVYAQYGFVLTNPLLNAPLGQKISYPPLFDFLIASIGMVTKADLFQVARFIQPFLVMFIVLAVSYVSRKFYGTIAGISTGFLILSSLLLGNRLIFPLPENLALIFFPLAVYFYYHSLKEKSLKYSVLAGSLLIIILLIHQSAPLILFLVISAITMVELIFYRNIHSFKNYGAFLIIPLILLILTLLIFLLGLIPGLTNIFSNILNHGVQEAFSTSSVAYSQPLKISSYGNLGVLTLIFGLIGAVAAIKRRQKRDIVILTWIFTIILLINAYIFGINGINSISYRLLVYLLIPVSILGGFGISSVYHKLRDYKRFSSKNFRTAFLISIFLLATFDGVLTVENPLISSFEITNQYGSFQIAPPSSSEEDLVNWFNENGDKNKSILSNDLFPLTYVTAQTGMSLASDTKFKYFNKNLSESFFEKNKIGYVVLDKRLSFNSDNGTLYKVEYDGKFYKLFYYSEDISSNINNILPNYMTVVYENNYFIICKVQ
ncbi:MAG: hypothetical protein K8E24_004485 [Methanobacterium paludis]|nr:hypothetical protein [Methanobacterium paludis]